MDKTEYKIGDRVICVRGNYSGEIIKVSIDVTRTNNRYYIIYNTIHAVSGARVQKWEGCEDIKINIEYYRDLKIEQILDGDR